MYDVESRTLNRKLVGHTLPVITVDVSKDQIASGSADGSIRLWPAF